MGEERCVATLHVKAGHKFIPKFKCRSSPQEKTNFEKPASALFIGTISLHCHHYTVHFFTTDVKDVGSCVWLQKFPKDLL